MVELDKLSLYFLQDYRINDKIILKQPTIGQIAAFGEAKYFSMAQRLTLIPSDLKSDLDDLGIDYEEISDFELFILMSDGLTTNDTSLLLGDLNLSDFESRKNNQTDEFYLYNPKTDVTIDRYIHLLITNYICQLHGFTKKIEKAANKYTKKVLIDEDRDKKNKEKDSEYKSYLLPLVSSMVNSSEFKYTSKELMNVGIYEFMDSIKRISLIRRVKALEIGAYTGFRDFSKTNASDFDWTRELD